MFKASFASLALVLAIVLPAAALAGTVTKICVRRFTSSTRTASRPARSTPAP